MQLNITIDYSDEVFGRRGSEFSEYSSILSYIVSSKPPVSFKIIKTFL